MTRVDFYQIESDEPALLFTCRLIDKIYHQGLRVHVHTSSIAQSDELDDLLWSFRPERFIPHAQVGRDDQAPVSIAHDAEPELHEEVLVNLAPQVPHFFSRFERVAEVVPLDEQRRIAARENYRFYKDRGYPLQYHRMRA